MNFDNYSIVCCYVSIITPFELFVKNFVSVPLHMRWTYLNQNLFLNSCYDCIISTIYCQIFLVVFLQHVKYVMPNFITLSNRIINSTVIGELDSILPNNLSKRLMSSFQHNKISKLLG